jgi:hypothetical protein
MSANQLKPEQAAQILTNLFSRAEIVTFEYWADFIIRVQRNADPKQSQTSVRIPPIFCIRLESDWWVGDRKQWDEAKKQFPIRELRQYSTQGVPMRAAVIGQMLGSKITEVRVAVDGTLTILTTDNFTMTVPGVSRAVDYSWSVELPADDADRTEWSLVCEADGQLYGRLPRFKLE